MGYIIAIQAIALAIYLWYIGKLWSTREGARMRADIAEEVSEGVAAKLAEERARITSLRALLHEAAGLLMDERHRSKPRTGDRRKTDNYGEWAKLRDDVVKRIGGEA